MYEPEAEEALGKWSSSRYAVSELVQRRHIKWWLQGNSKMDHLGTEKFPRKPPNIAYFPLWAEDTWRLNGEKNVLVADCFGGAQVYEVDRHSLEIQWSFGEFLEPGSDEEHLDGPRAVIPAPTRDSIIISDYNNERILEVRYPEGTVKNKLTSVASGSIGRAFGQWDPATERLLVAMPQHHYVAEVDWDGTEHFTHGVYDTSGTDLSHLDSPQFLEWGTPDSFKIADLGNHRILTKDRGAAAGVSYITNSPRCVRIMKGSNYCAATLDDFTTVAEGGDIFWHWPEGSRMVSLTDWGTALVNRHHSIWEVDIQSQPEWRKPKQEKYMDGVSLDANETSDWHPFYAWGCDRIVANAYCTEAAELEILCLEPPGRALVGCQEWPPPWRTYDTVSVSADTLETYGIANPSGTMAVRVTMGSTAGVANVWVLRDKVM